MLRLLRLPFTLSVFALAMSGCELAYDMFATGRDDLVADGGVGPLVPDSGPPPRCEQGWADCDLDPARTCEVNTSNDRRNCGRCRYDCGLAECGGGACQVVTWRPVNSVPLSGVALGESTVLVGAEGGRRMYYQTRPITPGVVTVMERSVGQTYSTTLGAHSIAVDGAEVYWSNPLQGPLYRVAWPPGPAEIVAPRAAAIASGFDGLYFTAPEQKTLWRYDGTGAPVAVVTGQEQLLDVAADAAGVYWISYHQGQRSILTLAGGLPSPVVQDPDATLLALDATHLYWATSTGEVKRRLRTGSEAEVVATAPAVEFGPAVPALQSADGYVWWIAAPAGKKSAVDQVLFRRPINGGPVERVSAGLANTFAVGGGWVYWTGPGGNELSALELH